MSELHPFFVHFPIALLLAAVLFDVYGALKNESEHTRTAFILQLMAGVFAILAAVTGNLAESVIVAQESVHQGVLDPFERHVTWGNAMVWVIVLVAVGRTFAILEKKAWALKGGVFPVVGIVLAILVLFTGFIGGDLSRSILEYFKLN